MTIRTATPADLDRLLALALDFYAEDGFTTPVEALRANFAQLLGSPAAHTAVVEEGDTVVAFAVTTTSFGLENGLIAELEDLYVVPSARRRGYAAALMDESTEWARQRGCGVLDLVVAPNGQDVDHLYDYYLARGFQDVGRRLFHRNLAGVSWLSASDGTARG